MIKIGIAGIYGKMGQRICALAKADPDTTISAGIEMKGHESIGTEYPGIGITVTDNLSSVVYTVWTVPIRNIFNFFKYLS